MTAPISNEPTTTRLHHYAGRYLLQCLACIRSERNIAPARLKWVKNGSCERVWAKNVSRRSLTPRAGAIFLSRRSCFHAQCATFFALLGLMVDASAKKFALRTNNGPKLAVYGVPGEFFAETRLKGRCWACFFAPIGPAPRSCRRRGARGWLPMGVLQH